MKNKQIHYIAAMMAPMLIAGATDVYFCLTLQAAVVSFILAITVGFALCAILADADLKQHQEWLDSDEASIAMRRQANTLAHELGEPMPFYAVERRGK